VPPIGNASCGARSPITVPPEKLQACVAKWGCLSATSEATHDDPG